MCLPVERITHFIWKVSLYYNRRKITLITKCAFWGGFPTNTDNDRIPDSAAVQGDEMARNHVMRLVKCLNVKSVIPGAKS